MVYREWSLKNIFSEWQFSRWKCRVDGKDQRRMLCSDRKETVTTERERASLNARAFEPGYSSSRPHRVPILSAKSRKPKLQFARTQLWNRRVVKLCLICWVLIVAVRFSMAPFCLVSCCITAAADYITVWGAFSWHTLGPLVPFERLSAPAYLWIAGHVHFHMTTAYSNDFFMQNHTVSQSSNKIKLVSWTW